MTACRCTTSIAVTTAACCNKAQVGMYMASPLFTEHDSMRGQSDCRQSCASAANTSTLQHALHRPHSHCPFWTSIGLAAADKRELHNMFRVPQPGYPMHAGRPMSIASEQRVERLLMTAQLGQQNFVIIMVSLVKPDRDGCGLRSAAIKPFARQLIGLAWVTRSPHMQPWFQAQSI